MNGEPYLRKKGKKFVVERKVVVDGKQKTQYVVTLPPVKKLLELLGIEASQYYPDSTSKNNAKASPIQERPDADNKACGDEK